jgi:hypothetical protein
MRKLILFGIAALALSPAAALADSSPSQSAEQQCRTQRTAMGATAFGALYGTNANKSNAFGRCVSKLAAQDQQAEQAAASACKTEQAADPAAFAKKYGTGNGKNAFGKCHGERVEDVCRRAKDAR